MDRSCPSPESRQAPRTLGLALLTLITVAPGCITETRTQSAGPGTVSITRTEPERAWSVTDGGEAHGYVVQFIDPARAEEIRSQYFSVRNLLHQELGTIDSLGRAWRFVPHQREAVMLGAGTVVGGTRQILGLGPLAKLEEVSLEELRAAVQPRFTDATVNSLPPSSPGTPQTTEESDTLP